MFDGNYDAQPIQEENALLIPEYEYDDEARGTEEPVPTSRRQQLCAGRKNISDAELHEETDAMLGARRDASKVVKFGKEVYSGMRDVDGVAQKYNFVQHDIRVTEKDGKIEVTYTKAFFRNRDDESRQKQDVHDPYSFGSEPVGKPVTAVMTFHRHQYVPCVSQSGNVEMVLAEDLTVWRNHQQALLGCGSLGLVRAYVDWKRR